MSCKVSDPLCPSLYEGGECDCDNDPDATLMSEYRIRAENAEMMLRRLVRAIKKGDVPADLLAAAHKLATKYHDALR